MAVDIGTVSLPKDSAAPFPTKQYYVSTDGSEHETEADALRRNREYASELKVAVYLDHLNDRYSDRFKSHIRTIVMEWERFRVDGTL